MEPIVKWVGGKRWLAPTLLSLYKPFEGARIVEPFAGGLAFSFYVEPARVLVGDTNKHLINLYKTVKSNKVTWADLPKNDEQTYYTVRSQFNNGIADKALRAAYFFYLNRYGYYGVWRENSKGEFNVPYGRYKEVRYVNFSQYTETMQNWHMEAQDWKTTLGQTGPTDFIYADPPYYQTFNQYSLKPFTWQDHINLAEHLAQISNPVVITNSDNRQVLELYTSLGFNTFRVQTAQRFYGDSPYEIVATKGVKHDV